jgi:disulfide bond formation protein DsbB
VPKRDQAGELAREGLMAAGNAFNWIAGLPAKRAAWIALAGTGLLLEASALFFQYGLHLNPCVMCIYIRMAVLGVVAAGLLGAIAPGKPLMQWLGLAAWGAAAAEGVSLSRELIAIQTADPNSFTAVCSFLPKFPSWLPLHEWFPAFFMPTGSCSDEVWSWLGLSMAEWMLYIFIAYLVALAIVVIARLVGRPATGLGARP